MLLLYFFYQNKQGCDYFAINKQRSAEARGQNSRLAPGPATLSRGGGCAVHAPHHPTAVGVLSGRSPAASRLGKRPPPPPTQGTLGETPCEGRWSEAWRTALLVLGHALLREGRSGVGGPPWMAAGRRREHGGGVFLWQRGPRIPHSTQSK